MSKKRWTNLKNSEQLQYLPEQQCSGTLVPMWLDSVRTLSIFGSSAINGLVVYSDWLIDWLIDWVSEWVSVCLIDWLIGRFCVTYMPGIQLMCILL